jgi:hydrogenase maturation protease
MDGKPAGTVSVLRPRFASDFPSALSVHDLGLKDMIEAVYLLEHQPDLYLVTISIDRIDPMSVDLSEAVESAIPKAIENIITLSRKLYSQNLPVGEQL